VITPAQVLSPDQRAKAPPMGAGYDATAIWQDLLTVAAPVSPAGNPVSGDVEELQAQTFQKVTHARKAVDDTFRLLGDEMLTASFWMDLRRIQVPARQFGAAPTAAWTAFRKAVPWQADYAARPERPESELGYDFLMANPASGFYPPAAGPMDRGLPKGKP
jgi:histidine ammonia-lyase